MKVSFYWDKNGTIWQGLRKWVGYHWYDLGIIAVDFYKGNEYRLPQLAIYLWKFELTIQFNRRKKAT